MSPNGFGSSNFGRSIFGISIGLSAAAFAFAFVRASDAFEPSPPASSSWSTPRSIAPSGSNLRRVGGMRGGLYNDTSIAHDERIADARANCGAYIFFRSKATGAGASLVIGSMLILSVPLRRLLRKHSVRIGERGLAAGAVGYGVLVGGTAGSGVILLSLLMAAGLEGAAVVATDAVISLTSAAVKISVFGLTGIITAQVLALAFLIGLVAIPGAFLAKAFVERMPVHIHTAILDAAVITGGAVMITNALRAF